MKKLTIVIAAVLAGILVCYFLLFIQNKQVTDYNLLKVRNDIDGVIISTEESAKYISKYKTEKPGDSTMNVSVYTTTIYNPFASKTPEIIIPISSRIKYIKIAGRTLNRSLL